MTPEVVAFAGRIVSDGWQSAVSDQLAAVLNDGVWKSLAWRKGGRVFCQQLAYIARELEKLVELPKLFLKRAVRRTIRSRGGSTLQAAVAEELVDHAIGDALKLAIPHVEESVRTLRVVGIWSCLQSDLSLLDCACFTDLASNKTKDLIKAELEAKIDGYVRT